jgi:hypothetical protein
MTEFVSFARRLNRDSSIDSICTKCYQTVACAENEEDLAIADRNHICDPDWVCHFRHQDAALGHILQMRH